MSVRRSAETPMSDTSTYREHAPHSALRRYVECYWTVRGGHGDPDRLDRVLPDGCMDIIFSLSGAEDADLPAGTSIAVGTMTEAITVHRPPRMHLVGVRFRAGAGDAFLGLDANELTDRKAALADLSSRPAVSVSSRAAASAWSRAARDTHDRLVDADGDGARSNILDGLLLDRLDQVCGRIDERVLAACEAIARAGGAAEIERIAEATNLSRRQLERRFASTVGIPPKVLCRVTRLRRSVSLLHAPEAAPGLSEVALRAGYADQPHFTREFRALAGTTPGAYLGSSA